MRLSITIVLAAFLITGCASSELKEPPLHDTAHRARQPYVDIAVNVGMKYDRDLWRLYDSLAAEGFRCGMRAMSLGAEQIVVEVVDFDRAKAAVTEIIIRDKLTVRVYTTADFAKSPPGSVPLEVWENGRKIREEDYKLYSSDGKPLP